MDAKEVGLQCPFCLKANSCQVQSPINCWCYVVDVPEQLLALVPEHLKHQACICASCIEVYHQDPEGFTKA